MSVERPVASARRSNAAAQRTRAVEAGLPVVAAEGLTTRAIQQVADRIGLSQPYLFRLFGSKRGFLLACLDACEARIEETFRAAAVGTGEPLEAMGSAFRDLVADGVLSGLWLQACAVARTDEEVAERCRRLITGVLVESRRLTGGTQEELARFLGRGALVVVLQAIGVDLTDGTQAAVGGLIGAAQSGNDVVAGPEGRWPG